MKKIMILVIFITSIFLVSCDSNRIDTSEFKEIGQVNGYTIYFTNIPECSDELIVHDAVIWLDYGYSCTVVVEENVYIAIKDNQQFDLIGLIENGTLEIEDLEDIIQIKYILPG